MGTPTFGKHFLLSSRWSAPQWGYLAANYPTNKTVLTIGGPNNSFVASTDQFATYNLLPNMNWTIKLGSIMFNNGVANSLMAASTSTSTVGVTFDVNQTSILVPPQIFGNISTAL
jgi:hypothetical protein